PAEAPAPVAPPLVPAHRRNIDELSALAHCRGIIAAIEELSRNRPIRHLLGAHEIAKPHFMRLLRELVRKRIDNGFVPEAGAGPRDTAIRLPRRFVGGDRNGAATHRLEVVWSLGGAGSGARLDSGGPRQGGTGTGCAR